jgi:cytidylate kinase
MKMIVVLVGPKGSGKSTIGDLLARELRIEFLRVEPHFLKVRAELGADHPDYERRGFEAVRDAICEAVRDHDVVCFESTGASVHVPWLLSELAKIARVLPVRIIAEADQCLARIGSRDASIHIPVSDDQVERINAIAAKVVLPWAAEVDNRGALATTGIVEIVRRLIATSLERGGVSP